MVPKDLAPLVEDATTRCRELAQRHLPMRDRLDAFLREPCAGSIRS
jgi:hypothetical protein